jgi:hypothetical protein
LDRVLDQALSGPFLAGEKAGSIADRVFAASRTHLVADSQSQAVDDGEYGWLSAGRSSAERAESLARIDSISMVRERERKTSGLGSGLSSGLVWMTGRVSRTASGARSASAVRAARGALAAAAAIAVVAASWNSLELGSNSARSVELAGNSDATSDSIGDNSSASSVAELTLVALLDRSPSGTSLWNGDERLGGSNAARLAEPVLRTQGADLGDIESELGAILGLSSLGGVSSLGLPSSDDTAGVIEGVRPRRLEPGTS